MPAEDPAFVALVMVDDPQDQAQILRREVSAPVFANIAMQVAQIMNIPHRSARAARPRRWLSSNTPTRAAL